MPQQGRRSVPLVVLGVVALVWLVALAVTLAWGAAELNWLARQTSTFLHTAIWVVGLPVGTVVVSVLVAHGLARWRPGAVLAGLMLVPSGLTLAVVAVAWRFAFAFRPSGRSQVGVVNAVVDGVGVEPVAWLTQEPLVNTVVLTTAGIWALTGVAVLILRGAMVRVPSELVDVARANGAGESRLLLRVIIPSIRVPLIFVAAACMCLAVATYDIVQAATGGRFGTEVLATGSVDRTFVADQAGRGASLALAMVVVVVVVMAALLLWRRRGGEMGVVTPIPRYRAEGREGRHSAKDPDGTSSPPRRVGRVVWRLIAMVVVGVWMVPLVGLVLTAFRPAGEVEASGWWTALSDPELTLDNMRTVLDGGMFSGIVDSLAIALPVAVIAGGLALLAERAGPELRRATTATWVLLAAAPVVAVLGPLYELAAAVGVEDSVVAVWVVHVVSLTPLAVLVAVVASRQRPSRTMSHGAAAATGGLVAFLLAWNDLVVATVFLDGSDGMTPATVRLVTLVAQSGEELHLVAAAAVATAAVPTLVLLGGGLLLSRALLGSVPDGGAGLDVEEVEPLGVHREDGVATQTDARAGLESSDAHGGAGGRDLVEGVGVSDAGGGGVDGEVDEDLRTE